MKQTAVEWLLENLNSEPYSEKEFNYNSDCWDKALEMEREQIMDASYYGHLKGWVDDGVENSYGEEYYNETFKSK